MGFFGNFSWSSLFGGTPTAKPTPPLSISTRPPVRERRGSSGTPGTVETARSDEGTSVRQYVEWKGWPGAFTEGYVDDVPVRDARFKALKTRYKSVARSLERYVDGHEDDGDRDDERSMAYVHRVVHSEGLDYAIVDYDDFRKVKDRRFHVIRRKYLAARSALARYIKVS